jgi:hypothetical protein
MLKNSHYCMATRQRNVFGLEGETAKNSAYFASGSLCGLGYLGNRRLSCFSDAFFYTSGDQLALFLLKNTDTPLPSAGLKSANNGSEHVSAKQGYVCELGNGPFRKIEFNVPTHTTAAVASFGQHPVCHLEARCDAQLNAGGYAQIQRARHGGKRDELTSLREGCEFAAWGRFLVPTP